MSFMGAASREVRRARFYFHDTLKKTVNLHIVFSTR